MTSSGTANHAGTVAIWSGALFLAWIAMRHRHRSRSQHRAPASPQPKTDGAQAEGAKHRHRHKRKHKHKPKPSHNLEHSRTEPEGSVRKIPGFVPMIDLSTTELNQTTSPASPSTESEASASSIPLWLSRIEHHKHGNGHGHDHDHERLTRPLVVSATSNTAAFHALRLRPGCEIRQELERYCRRHEILAASIVSCVGSVVEARLRLAGASNTPGTKPANPQLHLTDAKHEILGLCGTLGAGSSHLHITLGNDKGQVVGGHLMDSAIVNTTCEVVIVELPGVHFARVWDETTGYRELEPRHA